jgi:hypothetical protein
MQNDPQLPRRLLSYHYRIFNKHGVNPGNLAILEDTSRKWRPTSYRYQSLGCGIAFHFRICKTIDFEGKLDDPRYQHQQAFFVIAAHLGIQQHRRNRQTHQGGIYPIKNPPIAPLDRLVNAPARRA